MYPEIVRLATARRDPSWKSRLLAESRAERGKSLLDLFELVIDGHVPYRAADPIYEWRLRQLAALDVEAEAEVQLPEEREDDDDRR